MRRLILMIALLAASSAHGWERSTLHDVRFSPDGRYFAFTEYGEDDGSGAGFGSFYAIDTRTDAVVGGTPFLVELTEEAGSEVALQRLLDKRDPVLRAYDLRVPVKPVLAVEKPLMATDGPKTLSADLPGFGNVLVGLEQRQAVSAHACNADYPTAADFRLTVRWAKETRQLAPFVGSLPKSRGCAQAYGIAAIFARPGKGHHAIAVLLLVETPGWEGADQRYLAVTAQLR